jgi:hypothetical protein
MAQRAAFVGSGRARPSAAHTAPIYVIVAGTKALPPVELVVQALQRLDLLEARLTDARIDELIVFRPFAGELLVDGVPKPTLLHDREALQMLIDKARAHYRAMLASR